MTKTLYAISLTFALSPAFAGDAGGLGQNGPDTDSYYWAELPTRAQQMPGDASMTSTGYARQAQSGEYAEFAAMETETPAQGHINPELSPGTAFYGEFQ